MAPRRFNAPRLVADYSYLLSDYSVWSVPVIMDRIGRQLTELPISDIATVVRNGPQIAFICGALAARGILVPVVARETASNEAVKPRSVTGPASGCG